VKLGGRGSTTGLRLHDTDWNGIADRVRWVPGPYRKGTLDQSTVIRVLRCTERSFSALRDAGLTPVETGARERFDACDVRNVALYSGSGTTEVEAAMRLVLSRVRGESAALRDERRWSYRLTLRAPVGDARGGYAVYPPFSGTVRAGETTPPSGQLPRRAGKRILLPDGAAIQGFIRTTDYHSELISPAISAVVNEFLDSGFRWHFVPNELKHDPYAAFRAGMGNCEMLSHVLRDWLMTEGLSAEIYRGWIAGIRAMPHCWVEVYDEDGKPKVIDPGVLTIAKHLGASGPADYRSLAGRLLAIIIPTRCTINESIGNVITLRGESPCPVDFRCTALREGGRDAGQSESAGASGEA
jgi:hypothetical protein